ncbi:MAG: hypothetical protein ACTHU0_15840 [Kofleriaceae bacterium]
MPTDERLAEQIRGVLTSALVRFNERPFEDLREGDPQALIFAKLRSIVNPPDTVLTLRQLRPGSHTHVEPLRTSRVHRELKLHDWKLDIAVFREDLPIEMNVHGNGALDILATVQGHHLAAVIEIKAAPTKNMWGAYHDDLAKLHSITEAYPQCRGYFIGFDKSLCLGGTSSKAKPSLAWLNSLVEDATGSIEAHWLSNDGEPQFRRGRLEI